MRLTCSPMLKEAVVAKLREVLNGKGDPSVYGHLESDEREAIATILSDTTDWYTHDAQVSASR